MLIFLSLSLLALSPIAYQKSGAFILVKKLRKSREKSFTNLKLSDMIVSVRNGSTKIQFIR